MYCFFPVHDGDVYLLKNLLRWIQQLNGCHGHHAVIVADAGLDWDDAQNVLQLVSTNFDTARIVTNEKPTPGWIPGSNSLWVAAAKFAQANKIDGWLFMEPDAVPLKEKWLDSLEKEYDANGNIFVACRYLCNQPGLPGIMASGVAIYPQNAIDFYPHGTEAFDVQLSRNEKMMDNTSHTEFIQHFWGLPGLPPTFRNVKTLAPRHAFTLDKLDPRAVIFHRNKDGTLIELLRLRHGARCKNPFIVVLPVCTKDADIMLKCLHWMAELDGQNQFDCLIAHDPTLGPARLDPLRQAAKRAFRDVIEFTYPRPVREQWPDACNMAFQSVAYHVQAAHHRPWIFLEPDCVPLKPDWLPALWLEYQNCGQPIMGPVIEGIGHMNGTAIYPADFATMSPRAMRANRTAWDTEMTSDIVGKVHDCSRLWCHRWGIVDGKLHSSQGPAPHFASPLAVQQWIPKNAVLFHRCKDGSLIEQLRKMKK